MQVTRTLTGALVGIALGIALLIFFNVNLRQDAWWTFLPVGLATGLSMRLLASTGKSSYLRGALAAALTVAATTMGPIVSAQIVKSKGPTKVTAKAAVKAEDDTQTSAGAGSGAAPVVEELVAAPASSVGGIGARPSKGFNPLDAVWLGASVLIAYELGKGSVGKTEDESDADESAGSESSSDPSDEPVVTEA